VKGCSAGRRDRTEEPIAIPRTCGAARSARRPVKAEVAGSNPVRSATELPRLWAAGARLPGRVAQLVERAPEKREVTGSTPVPTTGKALVLRVVPWPRRPSSVSSMSRSRLATATGHWPFIA
jgi:hypothetical protein